MQDWSARIDNWVQNGAETREIGQYRTVDHFGDVQAELKAAPAAGLCDRGYRTILEITGQDRATWLHNLTTNAVRELNVGDGNYSFAVNVQGRILFDMHVLVDTDRILLDLDHRWLDVAKPHFDKYIITEDVQVRDRSEDCTRLMVVGDRATTTINALADSNIHAAAQLQLCKLRFVDSDILMFKHDNAGLAGVDLIVPKAAVVQVWDALAAAGANPVGYHAIEAVRIAHSVPWPVSEIHDDVLPAETGQFDRAVSFRKGCYLGQEVVERMRSRNVQAKILVLLESRAPSDGFAGSPVESEGKKVGVVTSAIRSPSRETTLALAYVRTELADAGQSLNVMTNPPTDAVVTESLQRDDH